MRMRSCLSALCLISLLALANAQSVAADDPGPLYTIGQRFGVSVATAHAGEPAFPGSIDDYPHAVDVGFGWYSDWTINSSPTGGDWRKALAVTPLPCG